MKKKKMNQEEEEEPEEAATTVRRTTCAKRRKKNQTTKKKQKQCAKGNDLYKQVTIPIYIKQVKGILVLSPKLLGVPVKMLGVQSNRREIIDQRL